MADPRREGEGSRSSRTTGGSTKQSEEGTQKSGTQQQKSGSQQQSGTQRSSESQREASSGNRQSGTSGTNRDFDENQESKNQGHGHPREERSGSKDSSNL